VSAFKLADSLVSLDEYTSRSPEPKDRSLDCQSSSKKPYCSLLSQLADQNLDMQSWQALLGYRTSEPILASDTPCTLEFAKQNLVILPNTFERVKMTETLKAKGQKQRRETACETC
jgi:hypothetical protein